MGDALAGGMELCTLRFFAGSDRKNVWETVERDDRWHTVGFERRGNDWFLTVDVMDRSLPRLS